MSNDTPAPSGLKAKVNEVGLSLYMKAPPKAQTAILNGFVKAQPVIAKVQPHTKRIITGGLALQVLRKVRSRKR
jgi:hypothetical protein